MEHRGASVGSSSGTGGTACSETFSFLGVDTTMVAHACSQCPVAELSPARSFRPRSIMQGTDGPPPDLADLFQVWGASALCLA